MNRDELQAKLAALPDDPGCYQMKDRYGKIIYVGKAKNLKNRVRQYFVGAHDHKTTKMVSNIADFDYVITHSEKEALVLEINLIKQHMPRFNIMFMDDKMYPYIKLTDDEYPVLKVVRDRKMDKKARYFGPYPDVSSARETIRLLNQVYPLRKCRKMPKKLCLYYHLGECLGPCANEVNREEYALLCEKAIRVLKGDTRALLKELTTQRDTYSERLEFEKAQEYQLMIQAVENTVDKQQVQTNDKTDQDVWHAYSDKGYLSIQLLLIREGKLLRKVSKLEQLYETEQDAIIAYLAQYYQAHTPAREILVPSAWETESLPDFISAKIYKPQKGHKAQLVKMAYDNAVEYLNRKFTVVHLLDEKEYTAEEDLMKLTGSAINRIEIFDNSHISGTDAVAGMVVYVNGKPSKSDYRKYKVHSNADDTANMKEVIYRRYFRLLSEQATMPDLLLVDGGYPQIQAAREVLNSLYLDIPLYGLVKDERHDTADLMNSEGERMNIAKDSALYFFLARIQDEVHRYAISYHRQLRSKAQTHSALEEVDGVGPARRKKLLKQFGSFGRIQTATLEELSAVVPKETAKQLFEAIHTDTNKSGA